MRDGRSRLSIAGMSATSMARLYALALVPLLGPVAAVDDAVFLQAQAPPPSPVTCEAWCPRATCCSFCDDPACSGCGAVRDCGVQASATPQASAPESAGRSDPSAAPGFQSGPDGFLYANGRRFYIKGVNWWGSETANTVPGGLHRRTMDELLDFIAEQGFNAIRLLLNHHSVLVNGKVNQGAFNEGLNPEFVDLRYRDMIDLVVRSAAKKRLLVMVNVHQTKATTWPGDLMWYDASVSEADALRSWGILAELLCPHWNAFAADLVNEPVKASWGRGTPTDWNKAAERFGDKVLSVCPRLLIVVQGVGGEPGAPNDGGIAEGYFWGENFVGARTAPIKLVDMTKLVYSPHTYGPGVYRDQPYFPPSWEGTPSYPSNMVDVWDRHFGFVQQATGRAVLIGEFGGFYTGDDRLWQDAVVDYFVDRGFGAFYFGLNPDSVDTGGLLRKDWATPEEGKLALLKKLPASSVAALIGEAPPSPDPPPPPPRPPGPPPPPHLSAALMARFVKPPPPPRWPSPPPPPWFPRSGHKHKPAKASGHGSVVEDASASGAVIVTQSSSSAAPEILGSRNVILRADTSSRGSNSGDTNGHPSVMLVTLVAAAAVALLLMIFNPQVRASTIGVLLQPCQAARPERTAEQEVRAKPRAAAYGKLGKDEEQATVRDEEEDDDDEKEEEEEEEAAAVPRRPKKSRARKGGDASRPTRQSAPAPIAPTQTPADDAGDRQPPVSCGRSSGDATANGGAASLAPGQRVRVHGLKAAPQHNGKTGIVIEQTETGDGVVRWNVCLAGGEKLALREANIEQLGAGIDAMVAALEQAGEHQKAALLRASLSK